jgi:hypothetical protein
MSGTKWLSLSGVQSLARKGCRNRDAGLTGVAAASEANVRAPAELLKLATTIS